MASKGTKVIVENRERDIKHLGVKLEDGRELMLGSQDDLNKSDKEGNLLLQPTQTIPTELWEKAIQLRAVRGMVESKAVTWHGA